MTNGGALFLVVGGLLTGIAGAAINYDRTRQNAKPPFWDNPCVQSRTENGTTLMFMPGNVGLPIGGGMSVLPMSSSNETCVRREWSCNLGGKSYTGPRVCGPKPPGEPKP